MDRLGDLANCDFHAFSSALDFRFNPGSISISSATEEKNHLSEILKSVFLNSPKMSNKSC